MIYWKPKARDTGKAPPLLVSSAQRRNAQRRMAPSRRLDMINYYGYWVINIKILITMLINQLSFTR